jgi:hypothetical protein
MSDLVADAGGAGAAGVGGGVVSEWAMQEPACTCLDCDRYGPCSAAEWQSTGPCRTVDCTHYGTEADGGLCEGCYIASK